MKSQGQQVLVIRGAYAGSKAEVIKPAEDVPGFYFVWIERQQKGKVIEPIRVMLAEGQLQ